MQPGSGNNTAGKASGGAAGTSGNTTGGASAGSGNSTSGSAGKGGTSNTGGGDDGGSGGKPLGGSGGAAGSGGAGGSGGSAAGMGGKGGTGGAGAGGMAGMGGKAGSGGMGGGGAAGMSGNAGSGGAPVDTCKNTTKDANETDVDCGGVCATKCATTKGCKTLSDCVTSNVCDDDKCLAVGCSGATCAYALTRYIIGSGPKGQVVVTWDSDSLDLDFLVEDTTPFDDSDLNWEDDSVEVYLDLNAAKKTAYETDDFQITIPRNAGALSGGTGAGGNLNYGAIVVSNRVSSAQGYSLTVSIPYSALNGAGSQVGKTIGFDVAVNDDSNGGTREGQSMLYGGTENYHDTSAFGALTLTP